MSTENGKKTKNIKIPAGLHAAMRIAVAVKGINIQQYTEEALKEKLEREAKA